MERKRRRRLRRQEEGGRNAETEREEELGQLVIHYRFPIIHSGPTSLSFAVLPLSSASVSR